MTARWHLGPITGFEFWRVLVFSPEVLIFLFFMITDPKTTPSGRIGPPHLRGRGRTPRGAADRAAIDGVLDEGRAPRLRSRSCAPRARSSKPWLRGCGCSSAPRAAPRSARSRSPEQPPSPACSSSQASPRGRAPPSRSRLTSRRERCCRRSTVLPSKGVADTDQPHARATDHPRPRLRPPDRGRGAAPPRQEPCRDGGGAAPGYRACGSQIDTAGDRAIIVPQRRIESVQLNLEAAVKQAPPLVVAAVTGTEALVTVEGSPADRRLPRQRDAVQQDARAPARPSQRATSSSARAAARRRRSPPASPRSSPPRVSAGSAWRTSPPRSGSTSASARSVHPVTSDPSAMMGGGVCWVDIDNDGWLDLFAVNSYSDLDLRVLGDARRPAAKRPLPQPGRNVHRRHPHVGGGRPDPGQRLRRRRFQRRRLQRPLRHCGRIRRAALERRQGSLHGGRPRRRDHRVGLALGRDRRRCER